MDSPLAIDVSSPIIRRSKHFFQESKDELITSLINKNEVISINDSFTTNSNSNNNMIFPIVRCNVLGKGSSSTVYKSVMLNSLSVCAEKVISVTDPNKKSQVLRELELLRSMVNTTICKPNSNSNSYSTNTINSNSYSNYTTSNSASDSNYTESSNSYSYGRSTDMDVTPTREIIENTKNCNENDKDISPDTITSTNSDPTNSSNINNNSTSNSASTSTSNSTNDNSAMSFLCPYVVNLLDVIPNPIDGTLSICLEYMDGGSLLDLVKAGGCQNEKELVSLTYQLLSGLKYLHDKRLIHRDIKPSNALISTTGKVKLADFGLTRVLDLGNSLADSFVGTFDFMAPERLTGETYSFSSDVWSFGITIQTVAIGSYPFSKEKGIWGLLNAIQEAPVPLPSSEIFSENFIDFIKCCCDRNPKDRWKVAQLLSHPFLLNGNSYRRNSYSSTENSRTFSGESDNSSLKGVAMSSSKDNEMIRNTSSPIVVSKPSSNMKTSSDNSNSASHNSVKPDGKRPPVARKSNITSTQVNNRSDTKKPPLFGASSVKKSTSSVVLPSSNTTMNNGSRGNYSNNSTPKNSTTTTRRRSFAVNHITTRTTSTTTTTTTRNSKLHNTSKTPNNSDKQKVEERKNKVMMKEQENIILESEIIPTIKKKEDDVIFDEDSALELAKSWQNYILHALHRKDADFIPLSELLGNSNSDSTDDNDMNSKMNKSQSNLYQANTNSTAKINDSITNSCTSNKERIDNYTKSLNADRLFKLSKDLNCDVDVLSAALVAAKESISEIFDRTVSNSYINSFDQQHFYKNHSNYSNSSLNYDSDEDITISKDIVTQSGNYESTKATVERSFNHLSNPFQLPLNVQLPEALSTEKSNQLTSRSDDTNAHSIQSRADHFVTLEKRSNSFKTIDTSTTSKSSLTPNSCKGYTSDLHTINCNRESHSTGRHPQRFRKNTVTHVAKDHKKMTKDALLGNYLRHSMQQMGAEVDSNVEILETSNLSNIDAKFGLSNRPLSSVKEQSNLLRRSNDGSENDSEIHSDVSGYESNAEGLLNECVDSVGKAIDKIALMESVHNEGQNSSFTIDHCHDKTNNNRMNDYCDTNNNEYSIEADNVCDLEASYEGSIAEQSDIESSVISRRQSLDMNSLEGSIESYTEISEECTNYYQSSTEVSPKNLQDNHKASNNKSSNNNDNYNKYNYETKIHKITKINNKSSVYTVEETENLDEKHLRYSTSSHVSNTNKHYTLHHNSTSHLKLESIQNDYKNHNDNNIGEINTNNYKNEFEQSYSDDGFEDEDEDD